MNSINNILVPIDFSGHSLKALEYAVEIAKRTNATIHVTHVYRLIRTEKFDHPAKGSDLKRELEDSLKLKFRDLEYEYLVSHPIEYELTMAVGFAIDVIQDIVLDKKIDMVVMGTRGKIEIEEIFGSTTWSVIKSINCPVLAVPKEAEHRSIKNIIIANENQNVNDLNSFRVVEELAHSFEPDIVVLKCLPENGQVIGTISENKSFYKRLFKNLNVHNLTCSREKFIESIKTRLKEDDSDLLVLIPKENVFLTSYFKRRSFKDMVIDTKIPLLMIQKPLVQSDQVY